MQYTGHGLHVPLLSIHWLIKHEVPWLGSGIVVFVELSRQSELLEHLEHPVLQEEQVEVGLI